MTLASVFKFISEFKISVTEFMRREDVKRIVQVINLRQETNLNSMSELDLEGYIEFMLQLAYFKYRHVTTLASKFLPLLFTKLKDVSLAANYPLFQRLFENPNAPPMGDPEVI